jgi:hypothetical protein
MFERDSAESVLWIRVFVLAFEKAASTLVPVTAVDQAVEAADRAVRAARVRSALVRGPVKLPNEERSESPAGEAKGRVAR